MSSAESGTSRFAFLLSAELHNELREEAARTDRSEAAVVRTALREWLGRGRPASAAGEPQGRADGRREGRTEGSEPHEPVADAESDSEASARADPRAVLHALNALPTDAALAAFDALPADLRRRYRQRSGER